jgi:hypothetical protein
MTAFEAAFWRISRYDFDACKRPSEMVSYILDSRSDCDISHGESAKYVGF